MAEETQSWEIWDRFLVWIRINKALRLWPGIMMNDSEASPVIIVFSFKLELFSLFCEINIRLMLKGINKFAPSNT